MPRSTGRSSSPTSGASQRARRSRAGTAAQRDRFLHLYRGLRHRTLGGGRLARLRRRPVGIGRRSGQPVGTVEVLTGSHSHGQGHETTFAQLVSDRLGIGHRAGFGRSMATPTRCSSAWAPMARARARSACRPSPRRSTRSRPRREGCRPCHGSGGGDVEFQQRQLHGEGHRPQDGIRRGGACRLCGPQIPNLRDRAGLKEGAFYDPTNFTFPAGCHICELEVDPETGPSPSRDGRRSTISGRDQSDDRRGPGAWRDRPGVGRR
jgi:CO/xanthine dehydrogenase Mo-binding subunit